MIHIHNHSLIFSTLTLVSRCFRWSFREGPTTTLSCTRAFSPLANTSSSMWTCGVSWDRKGKRRKGELEKKKGQTKKSKIEHSKAEDKQLNPEPTFNAVPFRKINK